MSSSQPFLPSISSRSSNPQDADGDGDALSPTADMIEKTLIKTYPYPVVKGFPTYDTDYSQLGLPKLELHEVEKMEGGIKLPKLDRVRTEPSPKGKNKLKVKKTTDGVPVGRPPLSRSTSYGELPGISFVGPNNNPCSELRREQKKKGLRLSKLYDNRSSFGTECWSTRNAEYGSVVNPAVLKQKRAGVMSFENSRFLPHHPHWKDRPYVPPADPHQVWPLPCPKSTYMDLGSYYIDGNKLPPEYQYRIRKRKHRSDSNLVF